MFMYQQVWCLLRSHILTDKWFFLVVLSHYGKDKGALLDLFRKGYKYPSSEWTPDDPIKSNDSYLISPSTV
jgi:hypothetical protein